MVEGLLYPFKGRQYFTLNFELIRLLPVGCAFLDKGLGSFPDRKGWHQEGHLAITNLPQKGTCYMWHAVYCYRKPLANPCVSGENGHKTLRERKKCFPFAILQILQYLKCF